MHIDEYEPVQDEYFKWMCNLVLDERHHYSRLSYRNLLIFLNSKEFIAIDPMDENRRKDGIDLRYDFGYNCGYSNDYITEYLDKKPCAILEMMIALARRVETQIMSNPEYGDRTGQWFWEMINSLGLGQMNDFNFDERYCNRVVDIFLSRKYTPNGKGGLFTLNNPPRDLSEVEIWCQFMWYINELEEGENL